MKANYSTAAHYDARTIRLHWFTAALVLALWCMGQAIDWFPRGDARVVARSTHIGVGAILGLLLVVRIWWRMGAGARLAPAGVGLPQTLAKAVHIALYAGLLATVVLGVANVWVRGDNLFNLVKVPAFDPGNKALRASVEDYHAFAANFVLILAGLHAAAGLAHHYLLKDTVLARMLPGIGKR